MARVTSRRVADMQPTTHRFVAGVGYIHYGDPPVAPAPQVRDRRDAIPPADAPDGSLHLLQPPGGGAPMAFRWMRDLGAYQKAHGHHAGARLAFTAVYLSQVGWAYVGPADA